MNELEKLIFEDFVLLFFGRDPESENDYWRDYFLYGDHLFSGYMEAFPDNERALLLFNTSMTYIRSEG